MLKLHLIFLLLTLSFLFLGCKEETSPKPKAYLSLNYPKKEYKTLNNNKPYSFEVPENTIVKKLPKNWLKIKYPELNASIDITYRPVNNNLKELLVEAEKLVFEHTVKADNISWRDYSNSDREIYGKMCEIVGDAASQVQLHVTDSSKHFLKASLFFYRKPNYDSILPAVNYIKKDMIHIMETLKWTDKQ